jgi:hypothetical protein
MLTEGGSTMVAKLPKEFREETPPRTVDNLGVGASGYVRKEDLVFDDEWNGLVNRNAEVVDGPCDPRSSFVKITKVKIEEGIHVTLERDLCQKWRNKDGRPCGSFIAVDDFVSDTGSFGGFLG